MDKKYLKICPHCGSTNTSFGDKTRYGAAKDVCSDCEFGRFTLSTQPFPEIEADRVEEFKESLQKNVKKD